MRRRRRRWRRRSIHPNDLSVHWFHKQRIVNKSQMCGECLWFYVRFKLFSFDRKPHKHSLSLSHSLYLLLYRCVLSNEIFQLSHNFWWANGETVKESANESKHIFMEEKLERVFVRSSVQYFVCICIIWQKATTTKVQQQKQKQ